MKKKKKNKETMINGYLNIIGGLGENIYWKWV